ncbi:MAG: arginine--tRNA ligase [Spirochaeta sp. LUC14_002_19_P3]|nr:MAG: arginine--tRNA ligase [Spirochaeta sp. LUC14_002_19_P3]
MKEITERWRTRVLSALASMAEQECIDSTKFAALLTPGSPPNSSMGDLAFPMFPFAGSFKKSPAQIAEQIAEHLGGNAAGIQTAGPYLNVTIDRSAAIAALLKNITSAGDNWGSGSELSGKRIMIEFSSPNTNKPLHLGHLRNDILGISCARILEARGAQVRKVIIINNRGVHICKSMLAYQKFSSGETPESLGIKSDRFVGDCYVRYNQWAAQDSSAEQQVQSMLLAWENGDTEIKKLWELMNKWALDGIKITYRRTGISFDHYYFESDTYILGKEQIQKGLEDGVFYRHEDGSVRLDMAEIGLETKVLLRPNGTSVYITQDLGTIVSRHEEWPFDQHIYVVGSEQEYHFIVLFFALRKLGYPWASQLRHLSYGMVNLPEGKMKSREGTVVDADNLIDSLVEQALNEVKEKGRASDSASPEETAEKIAIAALHYYLLQVSPKKDMIFNPRESLSFTGSTGPYLQYVVARVTGLIAKSGDIDKIPPSPRLLTREDEWQIARRIGEFPELVARAAEKLDPSILANGLYELAKDFSHYYHEVPIVKTDDRILAASRLALAKAVLTTLKNGFLLLNIPYIESM